MGQYVLLVSCTDQKGLVHKVTGALYRRGLNVTENGEYVAEKNKARLGKVSVGKSCIRFKKLEDINLNVATELAKKTLKMGDSGDFSL